MNLGSKQSIFTAIGFVLVSVGVVLAIFWRTIFNKIMAKNLALAPDTQAFEYWSAPPVEVFFDVYLFNWTNPSDLKKKNYQKPILEEIGPYRFKEVHTKSKIQWNSGNSTISYKRKSVYYFDEEGSKGRLDDEIITLNAFATFIAYGAKDLNWFLKKGVSLTLESYEHKMYVTKPARELLFDGYEDELLSLIHTASDVLPFEMDVPFDRFGWMIGRNESDNLMGHYNIYTGQDDISKLGKVKAWNYMNATSYYPSPCNDVRGSGGEFYPPYHPKDQPLPLFHGELCRYLNLHFDREETLFGVKVNKFVGKEQSVDNGTEFEENICFSNGNGYPSGVMDQTPCRGVPALLSFPHFHAADPYYLQLIDGLSPKKDIHEMFVALEPETGIAIEIAGRLQLNVLVQPISNIELFEDVPTLFFPILWSEEKGGVPDEFMWKLSFAKWVPTIGYVLIGLLIFIGITMLVCTYACKFQEKDTLDSTKKVFEKLHCKLEAQSNHIAATSDEDEEN